MGMKKYKGIPYRLWNPYTEMGAFLKFIGVGPTVITRGEGAYIFNDRGRRYINGGSCIWNFPLGYGREEIVEAATRQMRELPFSSCWMQVHPRAIELAAKLVEITSGNFAHVMLGSNGTEAVEAALKIARQYHRQSPDAKDRSRFKIISLKGSYHGYAFGAVTLSGSAEQAAKFGPMVPGFVQIEPPYCYRCPYHKDAYPGCGLACAKALEDTIMAEGPDTVAAFIMEPVMGDFGVVAPPHDYYRRVGETCVKHGVLFIADEVTTGFGRTGSLFVSQQWKPQPDILCLGKGMSGGYVPLSATLTTNAIFERFRGKENVFKHGSTNSGHPVCAAVGLAAIDIILREKLPEKAAKVGAYLKARLTELIGGHPILGEVRGSGLMIGLDLVKNRATREPFSGEEINDFLLDTVMRGLMVTSNVWGLSLLPPFIIDENICEEMVEILDKSLHNGIVADASRKALLLKEFAVSKLPPRNH